MDQPQKGGTLRSATGQVGATNDTLVMLARPPCGATGSAPTVLAPPRSTVVPFPLTRRRGTSAAQEEVSHVRAGDILADRYRVERVLGHGGMGVVLEARHIALGERVAVKFPQMQIATHPLVVARFLREGRAAARIRSEHVARVRDVGKLADGVPYLVFELLDGTDLASVLQREGRLSVANATDFVLQACEAIAEAHTLGIVHRDLKPANLFKTTRADGSTCIKVIDFGISKDEVPEGDSLTMARSTMGSPCYMAPEQMECAKSVDSRVDVWSLGVVLFELLTGQLPFDGPTVMHVGALVVGAPPRSLRELRLDVPEGLEAVVNRCLEKKRDARFASVGELAVALWPFAPSQASLSVLRAARTARVASPVLLALESNEQLESTDTIVTGPPAVLISKEAPPFEPGRRAGSKSRFRRLLPSLMLVLALVDSLLLYALLTRDRSCTAGADASSYSSPR